MIGYLIKPEFAEKRPLFAILYGIIITSLAIFLAFFIMKEHSSLLAIFFVVLAAAPITFLIGKYEEYRDVSEDISETKLLIEHRKAIEFLFFLFVGITITFVFAYLFLPSDVTSHLFNAQQETIWNINGKATADAPRIIKVNNLAYFRIVLFNNIKIMIMCLFFSLIYGFGSIFILTWNASVIATAFAQFVQTKLLQTTSMPIVAAYAFRLGHGFVRYFIHGIFEISAFFIAGLAGLIIAVSIIRKDFKTNKFDKIILDANFLIIVAIALVTIGAIIETFITPLLY